MVKDHWPNSREGPRNAFGSTQLFSLTLDVLFWVLIEVQKICLNSGTFSTRIFRLSTKLFVLRRRSSVKISLYGFKISISLKRSKPVRKEHTGQIWLHKLGHSSYFLSYDHFMRSDSICHILNSNWLYSRRSYNVHNTLWERLCYRDLRSMNSNIYVNYLTLSKSLPNSPLWPYKRKNLT